MKDVAWFSVETCEGYKVIEKFGEGYFQQHKRILAWILPNIL